MKRLLWLLVAVSGSAVAGPFGLEMGMTITQIDASAKMPKPGMYMTAKVPKPHSAFATYALKIGPKSGLCWIKAIGSDIRTSVYGLELRSAFDEMKGKLEQTYGPAKTTDRLMSGSIWNEPKDFTMSLLKKERFLMASWKPADGSRLPPELTLIGLVASVTDRDSAYITVEYYFSNKDSCDKEVSSAEDGAL